MKSLPVPKSEQINAMLNGTIFDLLRDYTDNPKSVDFRKFLTITRQDLTDYLTAHRDEAEAYFQKQLVFQGTHDVERLFQQGSEYVVVSMDHGQRKCPRPFHSLAEAVAEQVLVNHGMY